MDFSHVIFIFNEVSFHSHNKTTAKLLTISNRWPIAIIRVKSVNNFQ